jgi:hypothetical protein
MVAGRVRSANRFAQQTSPFHAPEPRAAHPKAAAQEHAEFAEAPFSDLQPSVDTFETLSEHNDDLVVPTHGRDRSLAFTSYSSNGGGCHVRV